MDVVVAMVVFFFAKPHTESMVTLLSTTDPAEHGKLDMSTSKRVQKSCKFMVAP